MISSLRRKDGAETLAGGNAQLRLHEVDAGDGFGDRVLHLDARVHLDEVELAVLVHKELDGAGVLIADLGEAAAEGLADFFAHLGRDLERRRFFDQFLMAALDGALALEQRGHVAVLVGKDLELDVARLLDELLHVELAVAEGVGGLGGCGMEEVGQFFGGADDAHAASAAAGLGLEDDGVADFVGATSCASSAVAITPSEPGRMGTLASFMAWRAFSFSPIRRVTSGGGPMNLILEARQTSAKLAFSLSRP